MENYNLDCIKTMWTLNESRWYNKKKVYTKGFNEVTQNANQFTDSWGTVEFLGYHPAMPQWALDIKQNECKTVKVINE